MARAKLQEPLVREGAAAILTEPGARFVISRPVVSKMPIGYSTLHRLEEAIAAVNMGSLPEAVLKRIGQGAKY